MLSLNQVNHVCLLGQGSQECRFLAEGEANKFYCVKKTSHKDQINKEIERFKMDVGGNPYIIDLPLGDNCSGYTFFRHKLQGYDV